MDVVKIPNPASVAGDLIVVVGICLLLTAFPAGRLSDRIGRKPIVIASGILGAIGVYSFYYSPELSAADVRRRAHRDG